jgi:hypothetical protein
MCEMKPYGYETMHYDARNRMGGDLFNGRKPLSGISARAFLRIFKKKARRASKAACVEE